MGEGDFNSLLHVLMHSLADSRLHSDCGIEPTTLACWDNWATSQGQKILLKCIRYLWKKAQKVITALIAHRKRSWTARSNKVGRVDTSYFWILDHRNVLCIPTWIKNKISKMLHIKWKRIISKGSGQWTKCCFMVMFLWNLVLQLNFRKYEGEYSLPLAVLLGKGQLADSRASELKGCPDKPKQGCCLGPLKPGSPIMVFLANQRHCSGYIKAAPQWGPRFLYCTCWCRTLLVQSELKGP